MAMKHKNTTPHDMGIERSVLGSLMLHGDVLSDTPELTADYFFGPAHKRIFRVIQGIVGAGGQPDLLTVTSKLTETGELDGIGGPGALTEMYGASLSRDISYPVGVLRDHMIRRRIVEAAAKMSEAAKDMQADATDALALAGEEILSIDASGSTDSARPASSMIHSVLGEFDRAMLEKGKPRGLATGYRDFDFITGGLLGGQMLLIAGRPGMGKSAIMVNMADRMVARGIPVLIYSMEMRAASMMSRIICSRANVSSTRARMGAINRDEQRRIGVAGMAMAEQPLYIDDSEAPMILDLRSRARREVKRNGVRCIFVDYAQLVKGKGQSRENEVSDVSRNLKAMAMELDVPVVAAAQLNRLAETRGDNRPKLSDLRESGSLEQDADIVALMFRPGYYQGDSERVQEAEMIVAKHREGKTGAIPLIWTADFTRFDTAAVHHDEPKMSEAFAPSQELLGAINE
jgi:replicative DNA helicase